MIYNLIILTASLLFIWEFMKVRSTAIAQVEPILSEYTKAGFVGLNERDALSFQAIANNPQSFKQFIRSVNNGYLPKVHPEINQDLPLYENDQYGNPTNILNQMYIQIIQSYDTQFFAWRNSVNNAYLKLNGV